MKTITVQSPVVVMTDGEQSLIITDVSLDIIKDNKIPTLEESITIKSKFISVKDKPIFCHVFPSASIISYDLLMHNERLVNQAIKFNPDSD